MFGFQNTVSIIIYFYFRSIIICITACQWLAIGRDNQLPIDLKYNEPHYQTTKQLHSVATPEAALKQILSLFSINLVLLFVSY